MEDPATSAAPSTPGPRRGFLRLRAVIAGVVVDLGGTNLAAFCVSLVLAVQVASRLAGQQLPFEELQAQLQAEVARVATGNPILIVFGAVFSILGGFVAARIAKYDEVKHGIATGVGVILVSLSTTLLLRLPVPPGHLLETLVTATLSIGANVLGAFLAILLKRRKSQALSA